MIKNIRDFFLKIYLAFYYQGNRCSHIDGNSVVVSDEWSNLLLEIMTKENIEHKESRFYMSSYEPVLIKLHNFEKYIWIANYPYITLFPCSPVGKADVYLVPKNSALYEINKRLEPYVKHLRNLRNLRKMSLEKPDILSVRLFSKNSDKVSGECDNTQPDI